MDFEKICMMFTMQEPYYGIILSSMERIPMPASKIQTAAVTRSGNVFRLIYNPKFIESLDVSTTIEVIRHEILHLAFSHFTVFDSPPKSRGEEHIRNIACDLEVNSYIKKDNVHNLPLYYPSLYGWENGLGTKEYYRLLIELAMNNQSQKASQSTTKPCNGGSGGEQGEERDSEQDDDQDMQNSQSQENSEQDENNDEEEQEDNSQLKDSSESDELEEEEEEMIPDDALDDIEEFDDHSMWPDEDEDKETSNQIIEDMLVAAAEEVERNHGTVPGELSKRIGEIRNRRKPKPVADWKRYVRRYLGNEFSEFIRKSKKRESRRFPDAAGNRHRRKSNILVAIDTSGSVSMPEYLEFFGQIRTLTAVANFDVVECDAVIQNTYRFNGRPNMELHGGGGTSFQPVIDMYLENIKKYDALIYFTDGFCNVPSNTPKDTLWVISSKGDKSSAPEFRKNGASVVYIPKKDN